MSESRNNLENYDLTAEKHEALVAISKHAIAPPLSPTARAVLRAATDAYNRIRLLAIADQLDTRGNP